MIARYRRELSVAVAFVVLLLVLAAVAPGFFRAGQLRPLVVAERPRAGGGGGDDAGDPLPADRHLDRLDLQHLRRGRRACCRARACRWRSSAWGRSRPAAAWARSTAALVAGLGLPSIVVTLATLVIGRESLAIPARGGIRPRPAAGLPVVRRRPVGRPVAGGGDRAGRLRGVRLGPAAPRGRPGRVCHGLGPRGRPAGRHPPASRDVRRLRRDGRAGRPGGAAERRPPAGRRPQRRHRAWSSRSSPRWWWAAWRSRAAAARSPAP